MASGGETDSTPQVEENHTEMPGKKRTLRQRLAKVKKFFGFKNKSNKDDDNVLSVGVKAKSTNDVLRAQKYADDVDEDQAHLSSNKNLSMSADSVFSTERPQIPGLGHLKDGARSMEAINNELFEKVRRRRNDEEASDEGLPHSPLTHPTTADIIASGLKGKEKSKSRESENSLISMSSSDNELDEDMFGAKWTVPGVKRPTSPDMASGSDVDLDVILSTSSLANKGARHKLALKPKNKRASGAPRTRGHRNDASPRPVSPLPQVKEESPPSPKHSPPPSPKVTSDLGAKIKRPKEVVIKKGSPPKEEIVIKKEPSTEMIIKKETPPKEEVIIKKEEVKEEKKEEKKLPERPKSIGVTKPEPKKEEAKEKPAENSEGEEEGKVGFGGVVLRRTGTTKTGSPESVVKRREKFSAQDPSKRQTVTGSTEFSIFGERKMTKRASSYETRNWDELDKPKEKSPDQEEPATGGSEFSQVFNKLRRGQSKKEPQEEKPKVEVREKEKEKPVLRNVAPKEVEKEPQKETETKPDEIKTDVIDENTSSSDEPAKVAEKEPSKPVEKKTLVITKEKEEEKEKSFVIEKNAVTKQESAPAKSALNSVTKSVTVERSSSMKTDTPEKKVLISDNDNDSTEQENAFKRKSPLVKDRVRSQTLPEQPVTPEILKKNDNRDISGFRKQRTVSQSSESSDTKANDSGPSTIKTTPKPLGRTFPPPKSDDSGSSDSGGQPAWIAMARKKTKTWGDDTEKKIEEKDKKDTSNMAAKKEEERKEGASTNGSHSDKENQLKAKQTVIPKEESKSIVRSGNCGSASSNRKSKVLDMLKNFEAAS